MFYPFPLPPHPAPVDYTPPVSSLTILSGTTQECITVVTTEDNILEDNEFFSLSLSTSVSGVTVFPVGTNVIISDGTYNSHVRPE